MTGDCEQETAVEEPKCWWCGAPADSREHKFKQSELRLNNGRGAWTGEAAVLHGQNGGDTLRKVQGPNSTLVKFQPSMCQHCNNNRSQPFDLAYDRFIEFMSHNEATIGVDRRFKFSDIYGETWLVERTNLIKYWLKHICCMAAEHGMAIPPRLIAYLDQNEPGASPHINLNMTIQADLLRLRIHEGMDYGSFSDDVTGIWREGELRVIQGHTMWGWVMVQYIFDADDPFGWTTFEGDLVQMGFVSLVSEEYTLDSADLLASDYLAHYREQTGRE